MYDFVSRNKRLVQVLLLLLIFPFALVGIDSYLRGNVAEQAVAMVGGETVLRAEYDNALREQTERFRQLLGRSFDPAMFDNNEVRGQILEGLVNQKLLKVRGRELNLTATDGQLQKIISEIPAFQEGGKFDPKRYEEVLRAQGMSPLMFEQRLREDVALQPLQDALSAAHFVSDTQTQKWLRLTEQQRELSVIELSNQSFQSQVSVDAATARAHYEKNPASYQSPEQVRIEYLILSQAAVAAQQTVDPAEVKAAYESRGKEFATPEERQASHILIGLNRDGKPVPRAEAKKKAEELLARLKAEPGKFAELAKAESDDPGSKDQGGDLGFFGRGAMVKPFEEAVFSMTKDEIRGPVESDFGFHIIRLTNIRGGVVPPFDEVKAKIEQDLRNQKAQAKFAEYAQKFQDKVFEQSDTFKAIAEEVKIAPVTSQWITRAQVQAIAMGNAKMVQAIFSPDSLASKKNTEAIEIAPNTLMSARVLEHKPAATRPFEEVKVEVIAELKRKGAAELAKKSGEEKLAKLLAGQDAGLGAWPAANAFTRGQRPAGVTEELMKAAFAVPADKLPVVLGGPSNGGGYAFVRVVKAIDPAPDESRTRAAMQRVASFESADLTNAYLALLKTQIKTEIKKELIEIKDGEGAALGAAHSDSQKKK